MELLESNHFASTVLHEHDVIPGLFTHVLMLGIVEPDIEGITVRIIIDLQFLHISTIEFLQERLNGPF